MQPDFSSPLDVGAYLDAVPPNATVKGRFFQDLVELLQKSGESVGGCAKRYLPFYGYPMRDSLDLLLSAAKAVYGDLPLGEALRRIGRTAYPTFASTRIGAIIFGVFGRNLPAIVRLASKAYGVALSVGQVETLETSDEHARVHLKGLYIFLDTLQVGVFEGTVETTGRTPDVRIFRILSA